MRLFLAVDLPERIRVAFGGLFDDNAHMGLSFVDPDKLHITIRFLGNTSDQAAYHLTELLSTVRYPAFTLALNDLGTFPGNDKPPHVLWAGIRGEQDLKGLRKQVDEALGYKADSYRPHLTLCRPTKDQKEAVNDFLDRVHIDSFSWPVESFRLYESPGGGGAFTLIHKFPLVKQLSLF